MTTFVSAAQGYDAVTLLGAAITKAGTTNGAKVAAALEDLSGVQGVIKLYNKPFTKTNHDGLSVDDFYLAKWTEAGTIVRFQDDILKSITAADLKR